MNEQSWFAAKWLNVLGLAYNGNSISCKEADMRNVVNGTFLIMKRRQRHEDHQSVTRL